MIKTERGPRRKDHPPDQLHEQIYIRTTATDRLTNDGDSRLTNKLRANAETTLRVEALEPYAATTVCVWDT